MYQYGNNFHTIEKREQPIFVEPKKRNAVAPERCPLCESEAIVKLDSQSRYYVVCTNTKCHIRTPRKVKETDAVEIWNNRSEDDGE